MYALFIVFITMGCKKKPSLLPEKEKPFTRFVSASAYLLDTLAFSGKYYMHFKVIFDVADGDQDIYFSQIPKDYKTILNVLGSDTACIHSVTVFLFTYLTDMRPESETFRLPAGNTARITYVAIVGSDGGEKDFYMQAYQFPYSLADDGTYEQSVHFDSSYVTGFP